MALVNGHPGVVVFEAGQVYAMLSYTVVGGRIVEVELLTDPERLRAL
jgi:RNA polymerase sigma-70 factor (ECF subfamily)